MREGWETASIEDVARVVNGGTPKTSVSEYWDGQHLWITPAEMGRLDSPYIATSRRKLTDAGLQNSSSCLVPKNSVILSTRAPIGHLVINNAPMAFNQGCRGLIPRQQVHYKYLYYFLFSSVDLLNDLGSGTTFKELAAGKLKKVELPVPPFPEQKRIVAILDEAFAGIATAVANTEKNLANARELFESYLNAVVSRGGEGWRRTKLGLEIDLQTGFAFKSKGYTKDVDGIRLLRGDNIIPGGIRWQDHKKWARDDADAYSKYQLAAGDVVLAMDRTWIKSGLKYAQLNDVDLPCLLVQRVARLRAGPRLNSDFLRCLIGSASFTNYVLSIQTGLGVPHISGPQISEFEFFMPPVDEQAAIALSLDDLGSSVGRLEANYETKYAALCELKQSLLQKAFSGELTATPQEEIETALA